MAIAAEVYAPVAPVVAATPFEATRTTLTRVLHLINGEHFAGAERVQDLLALRLGEHGFTVDFVCLKADKFPQLRSSTSECHSIAMRSRLDLRPVRSVARLIRDGGYELLHTHTPRSALVGRYAAAWAGVPMVHHVHSPTSNDSTRRLRNRLNAAVERQSLGRLSAAIAVSESMGRWTRRLGIAPAIVHVVPNGVPSAGALPERPTPAGHWTLGTIALFRPRKGLEVLLEALALLRRRELPVSLRAVGTFETPEYEARIKTLVAELGLAHAVHWTGFRKDIPTELSMLDLLVLPSLFGEGLPMVVLEGMSSGVPLVATEVEGVPEAIRDGVDGLIAEPNNAASLAKSIARVMQGEVDWQQLRASAHERHAARFSDDAMARGVAQVYARVLERRA